MNVQFPFRSSKSRLTKQQEQLQVIYDQIIIYMLTLNEDVDAETLWLGMRNRGYQMSISSFNNRLKKLVEAGVVEKKSLCYNKHIYQITISY